MKRLNELNKSTVLFSIITAGLAAAMLILLLFQAGGKKREFAFIYQKGILIEKIELAVSEGYELPLNDGNGGINVVKVINGKIGIASANCPDKTCVKTGFISNTPIPVICLPHKVEIRLSDTQVDAAAN